MKKSISTFLCVLLLSMVIFSLPTLAVSTPKVTFNANGGNFSGNECIDMLTNAEGFLPYTPQNPIRSGYAFDGWCASAECESKVVIDTYKFLDDCTLYARWIKGEEKIELINVVPPMPFREPAFVSQVPDDANYGIEWEMWEDMVDGKVLYSDAKMNDALDDSSKISIFENNKWYTYKVKIRPFADSAIAENAEIYINGEKQNHMISDGAICVDFQAKEPLDLTVYNKETILLPRGIAGDEVGIFLADYAGGILGTDGIDASLKISYVTPSVPSWLQVNQADFIIGGTRNTTELGPYMVTATISRGKESRTIDFVIPKTDAAPFISEHPDSVTIPCGGSANIQTKVTGGSGATYKWKIQTEFYDTWFDASVLATTYDLSGYNTDTLTVGSKSIYEYAKFQCEVTVNEKKITSNTATVYVDHTITESKRLNVGGNISEEKHSSKCSVCNQFMEIPHTKKWTHFYYPDDEGEGSKIWKCIDCGVEGMNEDYNVNDQVSATCYFYDNYDNKAPVGKNTHLNTYDSFESMFPSREGYVFTGWAFSPNAEKPDYVRGEKILVGENDMKFYAVWGQPSVSVGGVFVTGGAVVDIFDDETALYDVETGTLTLSNTYISAESIKALTKKVAVYATDFLEIRLEGSNYIDSYSADSLGIEVVGTLLISGAGRLEISDSGVEIPLESAIKADKVIFAGGFTYIRDCEISVDADAHFTGGICETYIGIYAGTNPYCAYSGDVSYDMEKDYYASEAKNKEDLSVQCPVENLQTDSDYIIIAPFRDSQIIHYNEQRDSIIMLYLFSKNVDVCIAGYQSSDTLLSLKKKANAASFVEIPVEYLDTPNVAGVKIFFWENGSVKPILSPMQIGIID